MIDRKRAESVRPIAGTVKLVDRHVEIDVVKYKTPPDIEMLPINDPEATLRPHEVKEVKISMHGGAWEGLVPEDLLEPCPIIVT
jgi:hypothetical protein